MCTCNSLLIQYRLVKGHFCMIISTIRSWAQDFYLIFNSMVKPLWMHWFGYYTCPHSKCNDIKSFSYWYVHVGKLLVKLIVRSTPTLLHVDGIHGGVTCFDILWQSSLIIINLFTMLLETLSLRPRCILDLFFVSMRTCCHKSIVVPFSFLNKKYQNNTFRRSSRIDKLTSFFQVHVCPVIDIINFIQHSIV